MTVPTLFIGAVLLNAALKSGNAGPCVVIGVGTALFTLAMLVEAIGLAGIHIGNLVSFAVVGLLWSIFFWVCLKLILLIQRQDTR